MTLIVTAKDEPEVQELVVGEDKFLMTCHREVVIFPTGSDARSFSGRIATSSIWLTVRLDSSLVVS